MEDLVNKYFKDELEELNRLKNQLERIEQENNLIKRESEQIKREGEQIQKELQLKEQEIAWLKSILRKNGFSEEEINESTFIEE